LEYENIFILATTLQLDSLLERIFIYTCGIALETACFYILGICLGPYLILGTNKSEIEIAFFSRRNDTNSDFCH